MISIKKNILFIIFILFFTITIFSQTKISLAIQTYTRVKSLELFGLEFFILIFFILLFGFIIFKYRKFLLFEQFILCFFASSILTDRVYKIFYIQFSDIFGLLAIIFYFIFMLKNKKYAQVGNNFIKTPLFLFFSTIILVCILSLTSPGVFQIYSLTDNTINFFDKILPWLYLVRISIIFLICFIVYKHSKIKSEFFSKCVDVLLLVGIIGCIIYWLQIILSFMGVQVDCVFNQLGFPRTKGLAHEPATFAHNLLFILVLSFIQNRMKLNLNLAFLIITIIATLSSGALTTLIFMLISYYFLNFLRILSLKRLIIVIFSVFLILTVIFVIPSNKTISEGQNTFSNIVVKIYHHAKYRMLTQNQDLKILFDKYTSLKFFGMGLYNNTNQKIIDEISPNDKNIFGIKMSNRNAYELFYRETGLLGISSLFFFLLLNLTFLYKKIDSKEKLYLFCYLLAYCIITLSIIRQLFFLYMWVSILAFYLKDFWRTDVKIENSQNSTYTNTL